MKLYDAPRCPYCARVRLVLAEKGVAADPVVVDLANRPGWIYELNPTGRVPVLDDGFALPESAVIMEYLEERFPTPPLLPAEPAGRARARLLVERFDVLLGDEYYAFRRGDDNALEERLSELEVGQSLFADCAYLPWVIRTRDLLGVRLPDRLDAWLGALAGRPSVAAELEVVRAL